MNEVNLALTTQNTGWKSTNDVLLVEVAALKKQMEDIQVQNFGKHLAAMGAITEVKTDLVQVAN